MDAAEEHIKLEQKVRRALRSFKAGFGFVESFCGCGGMSLGLNQAGLFPLAAFDIDDRAVETYNENLGKHASVRDVLDISGVELLRQTPYKAGELPLFAGGPPCQGFSKQKRGAHLGDERNQLVREYVRLVHELRPKFFFFENVAIFGQKRGREYVAEMHRQLEEYHIAYTFIDSADYGLAQNRDRFLVVGHRIDLRSSFSFPSRTVNRWSTVGEVLRDLPEPPADYSEHPDYPNHQAARVTPENIRRFKFVPQGGGWQDIPYQDRLACHQRVDTASGGWPDVYGRLSWNGQCPTITGGFDSFTRGRYGHPLQDRPLTPREAARLQGFPDRFRFSGNRGDIRRQIGNAVPPPVANAVGLEILRCLLVNEAILKEDAPVASWLEPKKANGKSSVVPVTETVSYRKKMGRAYS